jgi:hypothetical protein
MKASLLVFTLSLALAATAAGAPPSGTSSTIKKCQDATGKWHYGDTAAEECAKSKVIELSGQGVKRRVIDAPPTEAELKERERQRDELEREQRAAVEQRRRDELLLSTYGHEDDIVYARDRKLTQIEAAVRASEETVKQLRAALERMESQQTAGGGKAAEESARNIAKTKEQIARHEAAIATRRQEQEQIRKQYEADLERYRELKAQRPN